MTNRKKLSSWLPVLILAGLGISVSPHQVLTRTSEVSRALSPVLSSYEVIRMAPGEIERQVRTTGELRFRFKENDFYFNLEPHDMRAPGYRAVETGPGGVRRTLPLQPVHTFKGVLAGREDTRGRFNLTDGGVEGVVYAPEGWYYVEPLRNYLPSAPAGELVVYSRSDIKPTEAPKCGVSLPERLQRGVEQVTAQVEAAPTIKYEFDIATEADYEYVQALGGSEKANREIEGILNQVEGVYESELLLQLRISFQHTWEMEKDPYTATSSLNLFTEFLNYWNKTFEDKENYDLAHLWTGKTLFPGGLATVATVCLHRSSSYGLSAWTTALTGKYNLPAHEIGHNFGATHPSDHSAPVSGCHDTIMQLVLGDLTFCEFSRQEIATYVARNNQCSTTLPITLQPPTGLTATTVSNSRIDLNWQDNSANETGFLVQQRRNALAGDDWVQPWISIATTAANVTGYSDDGLLPGTFYHHRVRAFNDTESSAFSNEVLATTVGIQPPTSLTETAVSNSSVNLFWQDNSANETGFRVQRRLHGSPDWVSIATTAANVTRFSDGGLLPRTFYYYQIQAFNDTESSTFSNERLVMTKGDQPPTGPGIQPPTSLTATAVSNSRIDLIWQDNSSNEVSFHVQRRIDGSPDWVPFGMTYANISRIQDRFLPPGSTYHYRVWAFNGTAYSAFSNEAKATTLGLGIQPPTRLTATADSNSRINLTWQDSSDNETGFHVQRRLDGSPDWLSITITAANVTMFGDDGLIPGATYHYRVRAFNGTASSAFSNEAVTAGFHSRLFVPIVLRSQGRTAESFFTSELTLTNRGNTTAAVNYTYTAAFGGGSGTAVDSLEPGRQRVIPDAIAHLTSLGVPIRSASASGTLAVDFSNLSFPSDAAVTVRVSTPVEEGRAGLAYFGLNREGLLSGSAFITGLRQNSQDRSNVAVQNAGISGEERITLRVTVFSGDPAAPGRSVVLPDLSLPPGGFHQYNGILNLAGFDNGYVKVERVEGTAPYYAYGVINDNSNSDGSFVFPAREDSLAGKRGQTLPVILETKDFTSELTVTNFSPVAKTVDFRFVAEAVETDDDTASFSLRLEAGEQRILPDVVEQLRQQGMAGIGPKGTAFVGAVFATAAEGDMSGIVIGARTGSQGGGGSYSVFYNAVPFGEAFSRETWVEGLQQDEENRSNLALVNTGEVDGSDSVFRLEIYDGETGMLVQTVVTRPIPARRWHQINGILGSYAPETRQGYIRIEKVSGENPFLAYGVVNDGGAPGERSGDGAYLPARE